MSAKRISQNEARRLRKRVEELESRERKRRATWSQDWFGGVEIARTTWDSATASIPTAIRTARKLNHAVVAVGDDGGTVRFIALPHKLEAE